MIPSPGRIVHYRLSAQDAEEVNRRREDAMRHLDEHRETANGVQIHYGNRAAEGDTYPAVIIRAWGDTEESSVNLKVLLDGNDDLWVTSAGQGDGNREWREPPRVAQPLPPVPDPIDGVPARPAGAAPGSPAAEPAAEDTTEGAVADGSDGEGDDGQSASAAAPVDGGDSQSVAPAEPETAPAEQPDQTGADGADVTTAPVPATPEPAAVPDVAGGDVATVTTSDGLEVQAVVPAAS